MGASSSTGMPERRPAEPSGPILRGITVRPACLGPALDPEIGARHSAGPVAAPLPGRRAVFADHTEQLTADRSHQPVTSARP
jgi:hypothetical protein